MVGVIVGCKRMNINPDNVATPMAASFGDLITLSLLAGFSHWFYSLMGERKSTGFHGPAVSPSPADGSCSQHPDLWDVSQAWVVNEVHLCVADFYPYVLYLVNLSYICLIPVWVAVSSKHPASLLLLRSGWEPIVTAMVISRSECPQRPQTKKFKL